jgi:aspartyl-tRNA(Asn)/glutamyl-tRNA(Gln) amidotransferase subunit A
VPSNVNERLANLSVDALTKGYASGTISPVDAVQASLARIQAYNSGVNAYCFVDADGALKSAAQSENRWRSGAPLSPIDGVPTSTKDTTMVKGWVSTSGSAVFGMKTPATEDSSVVARLKEAGAVLLGLTTSPEIGWKGVTDSPRHGLTRNPWNTDLTPGGSSGGAAVAAALGMGCLHVGTDAGGSIRIPAGFTGVFGHKPSFGRVPNYPPSAFSTLAHAGPITRTVRDAAHMLSVLARPDTRDWYTLPPAPVDYAAACSGGVSSLRIAYCPNPGGHAVDDDVARRVFEAAEVFRTLGAEVEETDFDLTGAAGIFEAFWQGAVVWRLHDLDEQHLGALDPGLRAVYDKARARTLVDYQDQAQNRIKFGVRTNAFFDRYDLLLTPTLPVVAFAAGANVPNGAGYEIWPDWAAFCYPFNLTRQPACSIPCGFSSDGLPVGLQIIGRQFDDKTVLRAASAYEVQCPAIMPTRPM